MFEDRDIRTLGTIASDDLEKIQSLRVAVIGAGGLGGYVLEMVTRLGVGHITVIDSETFEASNLNRQLLSSEGNIGMKKVDAAIERVASINSNIVVKAVDVLLDNDNAIELLKDSDVVFDCVDNIETRFVIQECCNCLGIPFIHGAVDGWYGQVSTVLPGDDTLNNIYNEDISGMVKKHAASFIPSTVSAYQVSEFVKLVTHKGSLLQNKLLYIDLLTNSQITIDLGKTGAERNDLDED